MAWGVVVVAGKRARGAWLRGLETKSSPNVITQNFHSRDEAKRPTYIGTGGGTNAFRFTVENPSWVFFHITNDQIVVGDGDL